jgi:hypothetical protein
MSDDEELTKQQIAAGWTPEKMKEYVKSRNRAAATNIFDMRAGNINPRTGRPRRTEKFEGAAYGWNPQNYWRKNRGDNQ